MNPSFMLRCTSCDVNWPHSGKFEACPLCERETWKTRTDPAGHDEVLTVADAEALLTTRAREADESQRRHEEFNRLYAEREAEKFRAEIESFEGIT